MDATGVRNDEAAAMAEDGRHRSHHEPLPEDSSSGGSAANYRGAASTVHHPEPCAAGAVAAPPRDPPAASHNVNYGFERLRSMPCRARPDTGARSTPSTSGVIRVRRR